MSKKKKEIPPNPAPNVVESSPLQKEQGRPGRPLKDIDIELVGKLAHIHCTKREIASIVGCDVDLLDAPRISPTLLKGFDEGKMSLKRKMFEIALRGNATMLIWLSKQYLGMRDKQPDEVSQVNYTVVVNEVPK